MKKVSVGYLILASAIIWGAVIIASSFILRGTEYAVSINSLLSGGVAAHLLFIWAPMGVIFKKLKDELNKFLEK